MFRNIMFFTLGIAEGATVTLDVLNKISHGPALLTTAIIAIAFMVLKLNEMLQK